MAEKSIAMVFVEAELLILEAALKSLTTSDEDNELRYKLYKRIERNLEEMADNNDERRDLK